MNSQTESSWKLETIYLVDKKTVKKNYQPNKPYDNNTLPTPSNRSLVNVQIERVALSKITQNVMSGLACVVYSFDDSAKSGVGNDMVQSLSVNCIQRNLPLLGTFTEKRDVLADLIRFTVEILPRHQAISTALKLFFAKFSLL